MLPPLLLLVGACAVRTVYVGGPVLTVDPSDRVVAALGVERDHIGAVGTEAEVRAWAGKGARVVDLDGRAVIPGFVDAHGHFPGEGAWPYVADLRPSPAGAADDLAALLATLAARSRATPRGQWVVGMGYDDTAMREQRHPTLAEVDAATAGRPALLVHVSGHLAVANSAALARLGYDRDTPDPPGGTFGRDPATGELTGLLEEHALDRFREHALSPGLVRGLRIVAGAGRQAVSAGVTTAQVGYAEAAHVRLFARVAALHLVPVRLVVWPSPEAVDGALAAGRPLARRESDRFEIGAVKLYADGSIQGWTGWLREPYATPPGDDPTWRGYPRTPPDQLADQVQRYSVAGYQVAVHANGDAAIDATLDAIEAGIPAEVTDARPIVVHAQMARDDQLDRMARLGVIASFFSLHTWYWGDRHRDLFLGPERAGRISPAHSAQDRGLRFTLHCDSPIVPLSPLTLLARAVDRRTSSGAALGPEERIAPNAALRALTIDAAWQGFDESSRGSLEVGKLADFVVLDRSPLGEGVDLDAVTVLETYVGGRRVYRR